MPARPTATAVIFDLDGTLVQTRAASWEVFRAVNDEFGLGLDSAEQYFDLFRGNLFASLELLCAQRADSSKVTAAFLGRLRDEYHPAMIPGMAEVIRRLAGYCTLAVVSSNAMEVLRRVLLENEVAYCFAHVFGGDVAPGKVDAIRSFLADGGSRYGRRCEVSYDETTAARAPDRTTTVLVTDTVGDVQEALAAGIRAVGVAWGMHSTEELIGAGAEFVAIWPQELPGYLLGASGADPPAGACALPSAGGVAAGGDLTPGAAEETPCSCGCSDPAAVRLAAAGRIRRERRQRQRPTAHQPVAPWLEKPGQPVPRELTDAIRRILRLT